ncbi:MAG: hypothetical protein AAFU85_16080 [Planctomycetota bacterium]
MALRRLWNSIRGVPENSTPAPLGGNEEATPKRAPGKLSRSERIEITREDKRLCRRLSKSSIGSILEVNVGTGVRAAAILEALAGRREMPPVRYVAIDQFELGGNGLPLRDFHIRLRPFDARIQMVPLDVTAGLQRVASTIGAVDFIVWGEPQAPTGRQLGLLARVSSPTSVLVQLDGEKWIESEVRQSAAIQAA